MREAVSIEAYNRLIYELQKLCELIIAGNEKIDDAVRLSWELMHEDERVYEACCKARDCSRNYYSICDEAHELIKMCEREKEKLMMTTEPIKYE